MTGHLNYDIWIGSELGLLKGVTLAKDLFTNYGDIKTLDKSLGITSMLWEENANNVSYISRLDIRANRFCGGVHVGLKNGTVQTFNTETYEYGSSVTCENNSAVRGIVAMPDQSLIVCCQSGTLKHFKDGEMLAEKKVGDDIDVMTASSTAGIFATGGKENDLKVWQIDAMDKPLFNAKNVRNDFLDLRVPVWVSAIDFFRQDSKKLVIGTGHHSIRVYDRREKRRPVLDSDWLEHPITAVSITSNNKSVIVGNSAGYMGEIDLRTGKQVGGFKGNCGSIRSIQCHDSQPYVAACGLDRFLKVYDINTREIVKKVYMKSNLNCLNMTHSDLQFVEPEAGEKRQHSEDEEEDKVWEKMEPVADKKDLKKKNLSKKKKLK